VHLGMSISHPHTNTSLPAERVLESEIPSYDWRLNSPVLHVQNLTKVQPCMSMEGSSSHTISLISLPVTGGKHNPCPEKPHANKTLHKAWVPRVWMASGVMSIKPGPLGLTTDKFPTGGRTFVISVAISTRNSHRAGDRKPRLLFGIPPYP